MAVYTLRADQVPKIPASVVRLDPNDTAVDPITAFKVVPNTWGSGSLSTPFNGNAKLLEMIGRFGCGAIGVTYGLDLSAGSGSQALISPGGMAGMGVSLDTFADIPVTLVDGRNHIWLAFSGDPAVKADPDLTQPTGDYGYLGSVVVSGGAPTAFDYSGRADLINGILLRQTADTVAPVDTPNARTRFLTRTTNGLYLWDGTQYWQVGQGAGASGDPSVLTATAETANARQVTYQLKNPDGTDSTGRELIRIILADADFGGKTANPPNGFTTLDAGSLIQAIDGQSDLIVVTNASGQIKFTVNHTLVRTWWVQAYRGSKKCAGLQLAFT